MKASMVLPQDVDAVWPQIEKYMAGAAKYTFGRYETEDIYNAIKAGEFTLWIAFDDKIYGAVATNFATYPRGKYLVTAFCGGIKLQKWKDPMLKLLQHWAYDNGCKAIESAGRLGWSKVFGGDGYKPLWYLYELPAADSGLGA